MSVAPNNYEQRIMELLREHPQGLTVTEISRLLSVHRHTIIKYIYQLMGAGALMERAVGPAKMFYLREVVKA